MELQFRRRDYEAEEVKFSLPRIPSESHPLCAPSPSTHQVDLAFEQKDDFFDPLRGNNGKLEVSIEDSQDSDVNLTVRPFPEVSAPDPAKEWMSFKKLLMQRFPVSKMISVSSISSSILKSVKEQKYQDNEISAMDEHMEPSDNKRAAEKGVKVITQQEYTSRLHELRDEITHSWRNDDRVITLKLSIKVARLLMDTSVFHFYPALFVLVTDIMDLLGDMVWERIRQKAEFKEDGTFIYSLADNFDATSICDDAKETCNNWFCKIGSIRELLPRIYLELALLPCWRFLINHPTKVLQRLVTMTRGIADPIASAYCHLYTVHCAQKLSKPDVGSLSWVSEDLNYPGYLITGINDLQCQIARVMSTQQTAPGVALSGGRLITSLMEPTIEYIIKSLFKDINKMPVGDMLIRLGLGSDQSDLFGDRLCTSIVLHHLLKELPITIICSNSIGLLHLIKCNDDSSLDQFLNYKLLGIRLCQCISQVSPAAAIVDKVIQFIADYDSLDQFLMVLDAYLDIVLQNWMETHLNIMLEKILERISTGEICENALASLQSFFLKIITHFDDLQYLLSLNHFIDILDMMHGSPNTIINVQILRVAKRDTCIRDPTVIHFLFEVSQALHDGIDFSNIRNDENQHSAHLISHFVSMVDYELDLERNLSFLVDCRSAFGSMIGLKETVVHHSNLLAIKAMQRGSNVSFVKSCLAFSEVTIPSVPVFSRQMNLYLETAEVAFLGGLVSHLDGLVHSAINCMQNSDIADANDHDASLNIICKLCSLLILVPANFKQGFLIAPRNVFSFLNSQSWITSQLQIKGLCALISALATLSQNCLPSSALHGKAIQNVDLFFGDPTYLEELLSFSGEIIQKIVDIVCEEPSQDTRGNLALQACNCIASSFKPCNGASTISSKLVEIAKLSLGGGNKYLVATMTFLDEWKRLPVAER